MGNALSFLENSTKHERRGHHNRVCKEKQEAFIKEHGVTECEEEKLLKAGSSGNLRVNEKYIYVSSLKKINARRFEKRKEVPCKACGALFRPVKRSRPATIAEKKEGIDEYHIWCSFCRGKGTEYRTFIHDLGGIEEYNRLEELIIPLDEIRSKSSLRILIPELEKRTQLKKATTSIKNYIRREINEAYRENEKKTRNKDLGHYEFDF